MEEKKTILEVPREEYFSARLAFEKNIGIFQLVQQDNVNDYILSPLTISPTGVLTGETGELRLKELYGQGDNYVGFKAPDHVTTSISWTLPAADGTVGQVIATDGAGVLSFSSVGVEIGDMLKSTYDTGDNGLIDVAAGGLGKDISADTGFLYVTAGTVSVGTIHPQLSLTGLATTGTLVLGGGDDNAGANNYVQIALGYNGTAEWEHYIITRHQTATAVDNAIEFYTGDGTQAGVYPTNAILGLTIENGSIDVPGTITATTVGIGTATIPHDAEGIAKIAIDGADGHVLGPHIQVTTDADKYPVFGIMTWEHDTIALFFDSYYVGGGVYKSSDVGSNFTIYKGGGWTDQLVFGYDSGVAQGSALTWNVGMSLDTAGLLTVPGDFKSGGPFHDVRNYADLATAISTIGATETTLLIPTQLSVADDATIPATMTLRFTRGGSLSVATTKTVTINGNVEAGLFQIFEGAGTVSFGTVKAYPLYPEWFGALGDGSTNDSTAVQTTVTACLVGNEPRPFIVTGRYKLASEIKIDRALYSSIYGEFRFIGRGASSGFYVTTAITMFSATADHTVNAVSDNIAWENVRFECDNAATAAYVFDGAFIQTRFDACTFMKIKAFTADMNTFSHWFNKCHIRAWTGTFFFLDAVTSNDISFTGCYVNGGADLLDLHIVQAFRFIDNCVESCTGTPVQVNGGRGAQISGNYFEDNCTSTGSYYIDLAEDSDFSMSGAHVSGNHFYLNETQVTDANFYAINWYGANGGVSNANWCSGKLHRLTSVETGAFISKGDVDNQTGLWASAAGSKYVWPYDVIKMVDGASIGIVSDTDLITLTTDTVTVAGTLAATTVTGANVTTGADPGHTHTAYAAINQTMYIGTTGVAINRGSAALTLAGITLTTPDIGAATGTSLSVTGTLVADSDGRPVTIGTLGSIISKGEAGGWQFGYYAEGSEGTDLGGFWFNGTADALTSYGIGPSATPHVTILNAGNVGIGTATIPHGGVGMAKFAIDGVNANAAGPHVQFTTASDDYPLFQIWPWEHDGISLWFDSYFDGASKSSDAGSNYRITKESDTFRFQYDSGIAQGSVITWNDGFTMSNAGVIKLGDGTNYSQFAADGSLSFVGDATVWDDLRVPLTSVKLGGVKDPTFAVWKTDGSGSRGVWAWSFSDQAVASNEEELFFAAQLPHSYKEGSDITCHVHWTPAVSGNANEFVKWGLEYSFADINENFAANTTIIYSDASSAATATSSGDATLTAGKHYLSDLSVITGTNYKISSILICRVFRNSSDADDDLAQAAIAFEIDFHFEKDTVGSREILTK